jgi:hypothetical protein
MMYLFLDFSYCAVNLYWIYIYLGILILFSYITQLYYLYYYIILLFYYLDLLQREAHYL